MVGHPPRRIKMARSAISTELVLRSLLFNSAVQSWIGIPAGLGLPPIDLAIRTGSPQLVSYRL
jgi:hypothetical protein